MAYETHKLVQSAHAKLQIEALYTTSVNLTESALDILYTKLFALKGNYLAQKIDEGLVVSCL